MKTNPKKLIGRVARLILVASAGLLPLEGFTAPTFDATINKTVWKMLYGLTDAQVNDPIWLSQNDDGDDLSNQAEMGAGTNPLRHAREAAEVCKEERQLLVLCGEHARIAGQRPGQFG